MKKILVLTLILLLILIISAVILIAQSKESNLSYYTHTKAICNKTNYCQDYSVSCDEEKILMITPITGAVVQFPEAWKDPRNETEKE